MVPVAGEIEAPPHHADLRSRRRPSSLAPRAMPATPTRAKAVCCLSGLCGASAALLSPQALTAPSGARVGRVALCAAQEDVHGMQSHTRDTWHMLKKRYRVRL